MLALLRRVTSIIPGSRYSEPAQTPESAERSAHDKTLQTDRKTGPIRLPELLYSIRLPVDVIACTATNSDERKVTNSEQLNMRSMRGRRRVLLLPTRRMLHRLWAL